MRLRSSDLEEFLREKIDSGIVIRSAHGMELGQTGVVFQFASEDQLVMVVLEYATAGSLILAPLYAQKSEVEEIIVRETFHDRDLARLNEVHYAFLEWLQVLIDPELEPLEGLFFSRTEPIPPTLSRRLQSVVPLVSYVSAIGYPEGMIHIYTGLDVDVMDEPTDTQEVRKNILEVDPIDLDELVSKPQRMPIDKIVLGLLLVALLLGGSYTWKWMQGQQVVSRSKSKVKISQVRVPAGVFIMGCRLEDCAEDEIPHRVSISNDIFMMESEVTQAQYFAIMHENPSLHYGCGRNCPVENVTWDMAVQFANKLSRNHQYDVCYSKDEDDWIWNEECDGWRLPTEAEWEYAALGYRTSKQGEVQAVPVDKTAWYLDQDVLSNVPKVIGESEERRFEKAQLFVQSHESCRKARNGYGLCDMSGNVWEWVWNWYEDDAAERYHNQKDPKGPLLGRTKVLKGGAYTSKLKDVYPYKRIHLPPWAVTGQVRSVSKNSTTSVSKGTVGFRLVRTSR